jgi:hypothetical protein
MSTVSEIIRLASAIHNLCDDVDKQGAGVFDALRKVSSLSERAAGIRVEGVQTGSLIRALAEARLKCEDTRTALAPTIAGGKEYAAQLAGNSGALSTGVPSGVAFRGDGSPAPAGGGLAVALSDRGMELVDVNEVDLAGEPVVDWRNDTAEADIRWAVQRWDDTVAPGIDRGLTLEDFRAQDAASGAGDRRKLGDVWEMFLGDRRIKVDRRPDGRIDIDGGHHRFQMARQLGIRFLPSLTRRP